MYVPPHGNQVVTIRIEIWRQGHDVLPLQHCRLRIVRKKVRVPATTNKNQMPAAPAACRLTPSSFKVVKG
jgi:hypothetical protein